MNIPEFRKGEKLEAMKLNKLSQCIKELERRVNSNVLQPGVGYTVMRSNGGATLSIMKKGGGRRGEELGYNGPFACSIVSKKNTDGSDAGKEVVCARNGGMFIDIWDNAKVKLTGEDLNGLVKVPITGLGDYLVSLEWKYNAFDSNEKLGDPRIVVEQGKKEAFDPLKEPMTAQSGRGTSRCLLAYIEVDGQAMKLTQVVKNSLRAFWTLRDEETLGQLGDLNTAHLLK